MGESGVKWEVVIIFGSQTKRECSALQENIKAPLMIREGLNYLKKKKKKNQNKGLRSISSSTEVLKNAS